MYIHTSQIKAIQINLIFFNCYKILLQYVKWINNDT